MCQVVAPQVEDETATLSRSSDQYAFMDSCETFNYIV